MKLCTAFISLVVAISTTNALVMTPRVVGSDLYVNRRQFDKAFPRPGGDHPGGGFGGGQNIHPTPIATPTPTPIGGNAGSGGNGGPGGNGGQGGSIIGGQGGFNPPPGGNAGSGGNGGPGGNGGGGGSVTTGQGGGQHSGGGRPGGGPIVY
ncbi:hypothetical protein BDN72DRAFT_845245 [Pluteus cervinus]|uniref:Uncharacterized protein n=1 Tax=Pluteus cervinus TaxID=181527 RepID=A0ACD3AKG8_9AGAR|nr:hypothetical protein BDN72DRAFT_845245 [Pluteus cervinus]